MTVHDLVRQRSELFVELERFRRRCDELRAELGAEHAEWLENQTDLERYALAVAWVQRHGRLVSRVLDGQVESRDDTALARSELRRLVFLFTRRS